MRTCILLLGLAGAALAQEYGETYRLKIDVGGQSRKVAFFVPKNPRRGETFPVLVTVPTHPGKAFGETGQWEQPADAERFCVVAVDVTTSSNKRPWHPNDRLDMQRDMEAVLEALQAAYEHAGKIGVEIDKSAVAITGHSGGTFLAIWLGIRRPDVFLGVCGRSVCFFEETVQFGDLEKTKPKPTQPIFLFRGEFDAARCKKETEKAKKALEEAGWKDVRYQVIAKMSHESKPEVAVEWFTKLLKDTAKGRKEHRKIAEDLAELRADLEAGKPGVLGKLEKLAAREEKCGFPAGAQDLLDSLVKKAEADLERAANLVAGHQYAEAAEVYKQVEKEYRSLDVGKQARSRRVKLVRSDAFKAAELLAKAKEYREKDRRDRAFSLLEKIVDRYPETPAAEEARHLLKG